MGSRGSARQRGRTGRHRQQRARHLRARGTETHPRVSEDGSDAALRQCRRGVGRNRIPAVARCIVHHRNLYPHRRWSAERACLLGTVEGARQVQAVCRFPSGSPAEAAGQGPEDAFDPPGKGGPAVTLAQTMPLPDFTDEALLRARLTAYLEGETGRSWTLGAFKRFAVGFSWITYGFGAREKDDVAERGLILRLGPPSGLFAPYSAEPQFAVLKAIEGSGVPVPKAYWWSDDKSILGAPFFISERIAGSAPVPWVSANSSGFEDSYRLNIGSQFVSALAALHRCEWQGKAEFQAEGLTVKNAALRQIEFWEKARARWALKPYPMLHWALRWLREHLPVAPRLSFVHGDYRLGNFLEQDGRIRSERAGR